MVPIGLASASHCVLSVLIQIACWWLQDKVFGDVLAHASPQIAWLKELALRINGVANEVVLTDLHCWLLLLLAIIKIIFISIGNNN